jgi:hypothetical protein
MRNSSKVIAKITQVNYAIFGDNCYHDFLGGFSAVAQAAAMSDKSWYHGSHFHAIKKGDGWFSL